MSRIIVLSVIVASLSTIVGCGASAHSTRNSAVPASINVAAARDESCWNPPEETALAITESTESKEAATPSSERLMESYRPNRNDRPTRGAVHAATY